MSKIGLLLVTILIVIGGCGGMSPSVFLHDEYNFQYLERVAVIPFDNISSDQGAGARASRMFISELLAARAFDIIEPGEVTKTLEKHSTIRTSELTREQIVEIGKSLKVQGIILGNVTESSSMRSGTSTINTVTMVVRMVETETGMTVWSATHTSGKKGFWASLFGTGGKSQSEVMRSCIKGILKTLID